MEQPMIVGLTGGIATGKSMVASFFRDLGAAIIDADVAARAVVAPGSEGLRSIVRAFGDDILNTDGSLNRKKLGNIIFTQEDSRKILDSITHPLIEKHMRGELEEALGERRYPVIILDIPLLFETGLFLDEVDETVLVYAPPDVQLNRLMARDMLSVAEATERIKAQLPIDKKLEHAARVIDNSDSEERTHEQVVSLWKEWTKK